MKKLIILSLFIVSLVYCQKESKSCYNVKQIFTTSTNAPIVEIAFGEDTEAIQAKFQPLLNEDECYQELEFGLRLASQIFKTYYISYCPLKTSSIPPKSELEILINPKGQALLNTDTILPIAAVGKWISQHFPNPERGAPYFLPKEIGVYWSPDTPMDHVASLFQQINQGYLKHYELLAILKFSQSLCALEPRQLSEVTDELPYKVFLQAGKLPPLPPPPPPRNE